MSSHCLADFDRPKQVTDAKYVLTINNDFHEITKLAFLESFPDGFHSWLFLNTLHIPYCLLEGFYEGIGFL
jgi:hypothetical protein